LALLPVGSTSGAQVGEWRFDDPANRLGATLGQSLGLSGVVTPVTGTTPTDGAVRVGVGCFLRCAHGMAPNGGGVGVNEYSVVWDFSYPDSSAGRWMCLLQTDVANTNDSDLCIRNSDRAVGIGEAGYSSKTTDPATWYRLVLSVKNGSWFRLYLNGGLLLNGIAQPVDGRFALSTNVLFAADENGEDNPIDFTRIAVYDHALTADEAAALGGPYASNPTNHAPQILVASAGPDTVATGAAAGFTVRGSDADGDAVQTRIDWGDGQVSDWSAFSETSDVFTASHAYHSPTSCVLRALARDVYGATSVWQTVQSVAVTGEVAVTLVTPAYLQNMTPTGMVVMCESSEDAPLRVDFGPTATYGASVATLRESSGNSTWIHRALLTGLAPESGYHYRVATSGGTSLSTDHTFRTSATGGVDFAFGVWGDSQGHNHGTWSAAPLEPTVSMMKHMAGSGVAFGLTSGDLAESGTSYSDTRNYYLDRVARDLGSVVPWYVAWGNHDTGDTHAVIRRASDMPSRYRPGLSSGHGSYAFTYANCFFVCLDWYYQAELANGWLEQALASPEAQRARFRFVINHAPPYCERWIDGDSTLRAELVPLLERYRVAVCFSGHTHEYERGQTNGVYYVISGGGSWLETDGVVADWPHMTVGGAQNVPGSWAKESSWGVLGTPQPISGGLFNEYVFASVHGSTLSVECRAFNADGSYIGVLDQFAVNASTDTVKTWNGGGGSDAWNVGANWEGGVAPANGDDLIFAGAQRTANSNDALTRVGNVTVSAPGFTLAGQALTLNGNLSCAVTSGQTVWKIPTTLGIAGRIATAAGSALSLAGALNNNGYLLTVEGDGSTAVSAPISGAGGLAKSGSGSLALTGTNTYSGGTTLAAGSLSINNSGALGSGALAVSLASDGTFLTVASTEALVLSNAIALPASSSPQTYTLVKNASGASSGTQLNLAGSLGGGHTNATLFLNSNTAGDNTTTYRFSAANTFRATVNLNRGAIVVEHPQGLGDAGNLIYLNGNGNAALGDLRFAASMTVTNPIQLVNALSPIGTGAYSVSLSGVVSAAGNQPLVKLGSGTLTLLATNTYSAGTVLSEGSLVLGNGGALGSGTLTVSNTLAGGTFLTVANTGAVALPNAIVLPAPSSAQTYALVKKSVSAAGGTELALNGNLTGGSTNVTLFLNSDAVGDTTTTYRFSGTNTFRAKVQLNRGAIVVGNAKGLGDAANLIFLDGNGNTALGDLRFAVSMTLTNALALNNNPSPISTGTNAVALAGPVSGNTLIKLGTGTLTLLGMNTYSGATTVKAGTLALGANGALTSAGVTVAAGAVFDVTAKPAYAVPAAQPLTFGVDPAVSNAVGRLVASGLDITNARVSFSVAAPLTEKAYAVALYTGLTGAAFAGVAGCPAGYHLDYNYKGTKQIALVRGASLVLEVR